MKMFLIEEKDRLLSLKNSEYPPYTCADHKPGSCFRIITITQLNNQTHALLLLSKEVSLFSDRLKESSKLRRRNVLGKSFLLDKGRGSE